MATPTMGEFLRPRLQEDARPKRPICGRGFPIRGQQFAELCRSRAVVAPLARRCFGYRAGRVDETLGYRSASSIPRAMARVESGSQRLERAVAKLERSVR